MVIDYSILNEFAELVTPEKESKTDNLYGTVKIQNGNTYVQIDGSSELTPISTVAMVSDGDRVTVTIANHIATITGNLTDPSASSVKVKETSAKVDEFGTVVADVVQATNITAQNLDAAVARIGTLEADNITINNTLTAQSADISTLTANKASIEDLNAAKARIDTLEANEITTEYLNANYATVGGLEATDAKVYNLETSYANVTGRLTANEAAITTLETNALTAESADLKYANIDFSNITMASIQELFTKSGIIENLVVGDTSITGKLVGVTIVGDLIEGGTIKADKLVIKGEDGLYYKLNTNGESVEAQQTDYNSLNGGVITANSITASKINVDDLVAFNADIAGMKLTDGSIYTMNKASADNTTNGFYLGSDGQFAVGNAKDFLTFTKDADENYKLNISASEIKFGSNSTSIETAINDVTTTAEAAYNTSAQNSAMLSTTSDTISSVVKQTNTKIDTITGEITSINDKMTSLEQTADAIQMNFVTKESYDKDYNGTNEKFAEISKYIRFEDGNIILSSSAENSLILKIENDQIAFYDGGSKVAWWQNKIFHVTDGEFESSLKLGKFKFFPRDGGNLSFKKVG